MEQKIALPDHTVRAVNYLTAVAHLVAVKGAMYGNSMRSGFAGMLSSASPEEGLLKRIEDKLGRLAWLKKQGLPDTEDTISDIIGYFALLATWEEPAEEKPDNVIDIGPFLKDLK